MTEEFKVLPELLKFLEEDLGDGDITTDATVPEDTRAMAEIVAKECCVLAGLEAVIQLLDHEGLKHDTALKDGDEIKGGEVVLSICGDARTILRIERVVLNILMRMSGIATFTRTLSKMAEPYKVVIAGTRKTTPGFRYFEKRAIEIGGGYPHRFDLGDAFLIKDNHIEIAGLTGAISRVRESGIPKKIEVEVSTINDAVEACRAGADIVMLDNMDPGAIERTIKDLEQMSLRSKVKIELSGGISPKNLGLFLKLHADIISMGALTTGARWRDMSMRIKVDNYR